MQTDTAIEHEIQAKGLTAPRVTPGDIEANIASVHYFTAADGCFGGIFKVADETHKVDELTFPDFVRAIPNEMHLLTFCVLVLRNGFTVTGESACASPENFDADLGQKIAHQNAIAKVWPLMGYALKERLSA